jgi:5-methylcytosine-specific restriction protein A
LAVQSASPVVLKITHRQPIFVFMDIDNPQMVVKFKQCAEPACMIAVEKGTPRCIKHTKGSGSGWDRAPSKRADKGRLVGGRWRKLRAQVLERDFGCCAKQGLIRSGHEVDHIDNNGGDELENLQTICIPCHKVKTQAEARAGRE